MRSRTRLWAASGQSALESARVLVLSASATSVQALKNLVLPGENCALLCFICCNGTDTVWICCFTRWLGIGKVSNEDAGNNFFLTQKSIGSSRAEETTRLLGELNDNVKGIADTRVRFLHEHLAPTNTSLTITICPPAGHSRSDR
jgi:amyloid beta precursor protein binding protein 1